MCNVVLNYSSYSVYEKLRRKNEDEIGSLDL